jgi:hypothetical protein
MRASTMTVILTSLVFMFWVTAFHWRAHPIYADVPARLSANGEVSAASVAPNRAALQLAAVERSPLSDK